MTFPPVIFLRPLNLLFIKSGRDSTFYTRADLARSAVAPKRNYCGNAYRRRGVSTTMLARDIIVGFGEGAKGVRAVGGPRAIAE